MPQTFVLPRQLALDDDASPMAGALAYFFQTGTTTPQAVYADIDLTTPHPHPLVADSAGRFPKAYYNPNAAVNYRIRITTATGVQIYQEDDIDRFTVSTDEISRALYPQTELESSTSLTPATNIPALVYDITRWGADPTGVGDSQTAFDAARAIAAASAPTPVEIVFPEGTYRYTTSPDWAISNLTLRARGRVVLRHEGSGLAWRFGADAATSYYLNVTQTGDFCISGNANTTDGLQTRHLHHSHIKAEIRNCTSTGAKVYGSVLSKFDIAVTVNRGAMTYVPEDGIEIYGTAQITQTTACDFNVIVEGVTGNGLILVASAGNSFTGTSEGNTLRGVYLFAESPNNNFNAFFMEENDVGDVYCLSDGNRFVNCTANTRAATPPYDSVKSIEFAGTAAHNQWIGGLFYTMTIGASCTDTVGLFFSSDNRIEDSGARTWIYGRQAFISSTPNPAQIPLLGSWTNLTMENSWTHVTGTYNVPQYIKNFSTGEISLRGNIGGGSTSTTMFTLPTGLRPSLARVFIVPAANADDYAVIQVNTNGTVVHQQGYTTSLVLDQIRFIP
jgi:hypothetical protein